MCADINGGTLSSMFMSGSAVGRRTLIIIYQSLLCKDSDNPIYLVALMLNLHSQIHATLKYWLLVIKLKV